MEDYFDEEYDPNKNCLREEEMSKLRVETEPERCARATLQGNTFYISFWICLFEEIPLGSEILQWEDCKKKMAKKLWLRCTPLNIEKEKYKFHRFSEIKVTW